LPLATPGVRLRVQPSGPLTVLLAVFNGDPAGPGLGNPQKRNASGTLFRTGDGVFAIGEVQAAFHGGKDAKAPPITLKAGYWFHNKATPNQFFATDGLTAVAQAAAGSSIARENWSAYAVADATLLTGPGGKGGLLAFARAAMSPAGRSPVSLELAGGLAYKGPFVRDDDQAGLAVTAVRTGRQHGTDGTQFKVDGYESVVELSYQAQVTPWLQVQPDAQYVINPGSGIPYPGHRVGSAAVFGVRTIAAF